MVCPWSCRLRCQNLMRRKSGTLLEIDQFNFLGGDVALEKSRADARESLDAIGC